MRRRRRAKEGQEKRENKRPILKKLCAALLRSFKGQHGEKMKGVSGVTGTLGKTNSHFDPTQTGGEPHHLVEVAVVWCSEVVFGLLVLPPSTWNSPSFNEQLNLCSRSDPRLLAKMLFLPTLTLFQPMILSH